MSIDAAQAPSPGRGEGWGEGARYPSVASDIRHPHPTLPLQGEGFETAPLDRLSDFPAIPSGWAYLDTAATAQKPRPVIDAITRGMRTLMQRSRGVTSARRHDRGLEAAAAAPPPSPGQRCRKK
jgi:hypothetical protein